MSKRKSRTQLVKDSLISTAKMMRGTIVRVRLRQFMVFTDLEVRPGPRVNLLLAPNGCGKSSLISGIMLGLCGKPHDVGRATHVGELVKTGFDDSTIEIELFNPTENYIIERQIIRQGNKSTWFLNGTRVSQKQVEELMSELCIQVDNLCQVLPQDRVYEFSRMNPQTLLENTEKSVGPGILVKSHNSLKEMSRTRINIEKQLHDVRARLEREIAANRGLEVTVKMMEQRTEFIKQIEFYKQQRAWVVYREKYSHVQELKSSLQNSRTNLAGIQEKKQRLTNSLEALKRDVDKSATEQRNKYGVTQDVETKVQRSLTDAERQKRSLDQAEESFIEVQSKEEQRSLELDQLRQHLSKLENDLANYSTVSEAQAKEKVEELTSSLSNINRTITTIRHQEEILQDRIANIKHQYKAEEEKKKRLQDQANQRLNIVKRLAPDVYEAIMWLRQNTHEFTRKIYEPIMLEIDVKDDSFTKYLEEAIPKRDLQAFTCENKEDMNKFITLVREQRNLQINVLYSGPEHNPSNSFVPKSPIQNLQQYGFQMYIKDMFTAPETIMKYLCRTAGVYRIPVGSARVDEVLDTIPAHVNFFFSGSNKYFVRVSKYSKEKCVSINGIQPSRLLSGGVDSSEAITRLDESMNKLRAEKALQDAELLKLKEDQKVQEGSHAEIREEVRRLRASVGGREVTERRIKNKRDQIATVEAEKVNIEEERRKADEKKNEAMTRLCEIDQEMQMLILKLDKANRELKEKQWILCENRARLKRRENDARSTLQACADQEEAVKNLQYEYEKARTEGKQLHAEALKYSDGKTPDDDFYAMITETRETLSRKIQELQAKADFMNSANEDVLREYENRKKLISDLSEQIKNSNVNQNGINKKMLETREKWLPELKKVLDKINDNFGRYFARMGCAGEVLLQSDDPDNYEQYGIYVKVKFRDGDLLQDLNQFTQSGGERSLSIAFYMIAMQELSQVPFRCVDEINQGMDPVNERRVFDLLNSVTQGDSGPQYFILTPKLLPGLKHSKNMTISCIINGTDQKLMSLWDICNHATVFANIKPKKKSRKHRGRDA